MFLRCPPRPVRSGGGARPRAAFTRQREGTRTAVPRLVSPRVRRLGVRGEQGAVGEAPLRNARFRRVEIAPPIDTAEFSKVGVQLLSGLPVTAYRRQRALVREPS